MRGDFDEDELDDEVGAYWDEDEMCVDCQRIINGEDQCSVCGAVLCFACFEMGAGVCKGPHK